MIQPITVKAFKPCNCVSTLSIIDRECHHYPRGETPSMLKLKAKVAAMKLKRRVVKKYHRLTVEEVREIRRLSAEGMTGIEISRRFNTNQANVYAIIKRIYWKDV